MQFFKYWTKAEHPVVSSDGKYNVRCFGYSNLSLEDAFRVAEQRTASAAKTIVKDQIRNDRYYEGERPFREEIVEEFFSSDGVPTAIISRNSYGALILNTPNVFFADIDKPHLSANPFKSLLGFFNKSKPSGTFEQQLVEKIDAVCQQESPIGLRLYRTANGYRIIITSRLISAQEASSNRLLEALGSDRLYVTLCRSQDCYRARLTPKPWRCECSSPPTKFPFPTSKHEQEFRDWEAEYDKKSAPFATCALIGEFGSSSRNPDVDKIIQLHDHFALDGEKQLA